MHCATVLAQKLPPTHRVILVDRNSHFNHLYVFPRFSVLPGHEQKAFIPYNSIFKGAPDRSAKLAAAGKGKEVSPNATATTATSPNEHTFDLEMGSTATATRATLASPTSAAAEAASSASSTSSSSASSFSYSLNSSNPVDDDYTDDYRSDLSASSENVTLASSSSLLFDRNSSLLRQGGPHSTRSFASTISSLYSSRASADGHAAIVGGTEEEGELADKLKARLNLASSSSSSRPQHEQADRSQSEERTRASSDGALPRNRARSAQGSAKSGAASAQLEDGPVVAPLHVEGEAPPAQAVQEQEALGRQPMRVETAADSSSSASVKLKNDAAQDPSTSDQEGEGGPSYAGTPPHVFLQGTVTEIKKDHVLVEVAPPASDSDSKSSGGGSAGSKKPLWNITSRSIQIPYTHLVYALGSHLPDPLRTEARTKKQGMNWMREIQERVRDAEDIVLVGGGALGVQFASDIASVHGTVVSEPHQSCLSARARDEAELKRAGLPPRRKKKVTLIHSRPHLLPNFDERIHEIALRRLEKLGVNVVLGERLALTDGCPMGSVMADDRVALPRPGPAGSSSSAPIVAEAGGQADAAAATSHHTPSADALDVRNASAAELSSAASKPGRKIVRTTKGKLFHADVLLLCTGQQPNSALLAQLSPSSVDPRTRLVKVRRTLQVERLPGTEGWGGVLEVQAPCGDCDCFMDRKVEAAAAEHEHNATCECGASSMPLPEDADAEPEDRSRCIRNVYAIGDVADAFGALNAGYQAWAMADVAAENVLRDLGVNTGCVDSTSPVSESSSSATPTTSKAGGATTTKTPPLMLRRFKPVAPMLKLSLGLGTMAWQGAAVPHRVPKANNSPSSRPRSGTISGSSSGSDGSATPTPDAPTAGAGAAEEDEIVMRPEVMEKEDPYDLGVEGVWKFMANADTNDLYL